MGQHWLMDGAEGKRSLDGHMQSVSLAGRPQGEGCVAPQLVDCSGDSGFPVWMRAAPVPSPTAEGLLALPTEC